MNKHLMRMILPAAALLALLALAAFTSSAAGQDEPPPEAPAAPMAAPETAGGSDGEMVVVAEAAQPEPLGLLEIITTTGGDPWFKVGATTYRYFPLGGDCSPYPAGTCFLSAQPIADALDAIEGGLIPSDRYLHIEAGNYSDADEVDINGSNPNLGQLKGLIGTVDALNTPLVNIEDGFLINDMPSGFFLKGLKVTSDDRTTATVELLRIQGTVKLEDVWVQNTNAAGVRGLWIVDSVGSVVLTRVRVNNNPENGAEIDTDGVSGSVTITNSAFNNNGSAAPGFGLHLDTDMTVNIKGISASNNSSYGLLIEREHPTQFPHNVTITYSVFNENRAEGADDNFGLGVETYGTLLLDHVLANENIVVGMNIYNQGSATIRNSEARDNGSNGMYVNTCGGGDPCSYAGAGLVTLQNLDVSGNDIDGILIRAKGAIVVRDVFSMGSGGSLHNQYGTGGVTVTNANFDNAGADTGLYILSDGSVVLKNVQASGTANNGLYIDNSTGTGSVTLLGGSGIVNNFNSNVGNGIVIVTHGMVSLTDVSADSNGDPLQGAGAIIDNDNDDFIRNVTITNGRFYANFGDGLYIRSLGKITLNDVSASGNNNNAGGGAEDDGSGFDLSNPNSISPVLINATYAQKNFVDNNADHGIEIITQGAVTVKNIYLQNNAGDGLLIDQNGSGGKTVTLANLSAVGNEHTGIEVMAPSVISATNLYSGSNGNPLMVCGARFDNTEAAAFYKITIIGGGFSHNYGTGLAINSTGAVTLKNVAANDNFQSSAIDYRYYGSGIDVLVSGSGAISITNSAEPDLLKNEGIVGNHGYGITANTPGKITLKNLYVGSSGIVGGDDEEGIYLNNKAGSAYQGVTLTNVTTVTSEGSNLELRSEGAVVLKNISAQNSGEYNINITNINATAPKNVSLSDILGLNAEIHNIYIHSHGSVTVSDVTTLHTAFGTGLYIDNEETGVANPVTITAPAGKWNAVTDADDNGIQIYSNGAVTVRRMTAKSNGGDTTDYAGIYIRNSVGGVKPVTLQDIVLGGNAGYGVNIESLGNITITNIETYENAFDSINLENADIGAAGTVTVTNAYLHDNYARGMTIKTHGKVILKLITANDNFYDLDPDLGGTGVNVDNSGSPTAQGITLTDSTASGNRYQGFYLKSAGLVSVTRVVANGNGYTGININSPLAVKVLQVTVTGNGNDGIYINAGGSVLLDGILSMANGFSLGGEGASGINMDAPGQSVTIRNAYSTGNARYGIWVDNNLATLILYNVLAYGNDANGGAPEVEFLWE